MLYIEIALVLGLFGGLVLLYKALMRTKWLEPKQAEVLLGAAEKVKRLASDAINENDALAKRAQQDNEKLSKLT